MNAPRALVLASTSKYRRELLSRLGVPFDAEAPDFEEIVDPDVDPDTQIRAFARGKALSLRGRRPDSLIIGSDQGLVTADGELLGKPGTPQAARTQLRRLSGGCHRLVTSVAVLDAASGQLHEATDVHHMTFRQLDDDQIAAYVAADDPVDCAGSFKIEAMGIVLFERVEGHDPTAIVGLPLITLVTLLARHGVRLPAA